VGAKSLALAMYQGTNATQNRYQPLQRNECRKVEAKRGGAITPDAVVAQSQALRR
jgi:hypothetical protein